MKVIEHLEMAKGPLFSYEIVPPPRGRSVDDITSIVKGLMDFNPPWIDVTSHSAGATYNERADGSIERKISKKRPGTLGICGIIQNRFKIDTVAHLLCNGFTKEETEDAIIELNYLGIHNILAIRGDGLNYNKKVSAERTINNYAIDLVQQLSALRQGEFLDESPNSSSIDFGVGVAGYPEKHFESPNLGYDLHWLKQKVNAGADYVTTQMFFDNKHYLSYVEAARAAGITVPIIPGIKILKSYGQLQSIPRHFHVDLPDQLVSQVLESPEHIEELGVKHAISQVEGLLASGAPGVHFYIMNDISSVIKVVERFSTHL
ncbi:MAG: methylenetetrahydrofolate reductase [NAD(P)H] [Bdellovibrionales bacterium]|nr:methylenetetrahydrofolate reductase [NAD(P)H] [Bdellovibrionales bacterium]MBT3525458.1 methylenetetrahydrofolate reductase [NAD(P)H] [Bdellovibrionales bacterium]MBT7669926.1 methylenetetrahydrofolate reductase [NAD(P)H] [Bdellovibrionales bacterium]MBT7766222.1 methylenetetrahydrofolate reductase [NAD(P)H] [Bdellovibrionales bacterium]